MTVTYRVGDTRDLVRTLADGSVSLVATSSPFIALRSYLPDDHPAKHAEIGSEPDPATFVDCLLELVHEWGRVLAPWGSIAIELGDSYSGSGGAGGDYNPGGLRDGQNRFRAARVQPTVPGSGSGARPGWPRPKCLALVPQAFAMSLAYGRNVLRGPMPAHELLYPRRLAEVRRALHRTPLAPIGQRALFDDPAEAVS